VSRTTAGVQMALVVVLSSACSHIGFARPDALPRVLTCSRCHSQKRFEIRQPPGSLNARMLLGEKLRIQKGYVFEGRIVQKYAGSKIDVLLFEIIDYPCLV
jgi:hypothetical protein